MTKQSKEKKHFSLDCRVGQSPPLNDRIKRRYVLNNELPLNEFIKETIENIAEGINSAKLSTAKRYNNFPIAPARMEGKDVVKEHVIKFDIAISTSEIKNGEAKGKVGISVINIEANGQLQNQNSQCNRIQFEVPFYPQALGGDK